MEIKITKVRRAGRVFYAATVSGVYLERASLVELREAIAVRVGFAKLFAEPIATAS